MLVRRLNRKWYREAQEGAAFLPPSLRDKVLDYSHTVSCSDLVERVSCDGFIPLGRFDRVVVKVAVLSKTMMWQELEVSTNWMSLLAQELQGLPHIGKVQADNLLREIYRQGGSLTAWKEYCLLVMQSPDETIAKRQNLLDLHHQGQKISLMYNPTNKPLLTRPAMKSLRAYLRDILSAADKSEPL